MSYDNTNRGAIWRNDDKREDNHPDFKGSLNVDGVEYWVSAWKRKEGAPAKSPALSFSVKPKEAKQEQSITERAQAKIKRPDPISSGRSLQKQNIVPGDDDMDGDRIPF